MQTPASVRTSLKQYVQRFAAKLLDLIIGWECAHSIKYQQENVALFLQDQQSDFTYKKNTPLVSGCLRTLCVDYNVRAMNGGLFFL